MVIHYCVYIYVLCISLGNRAANTYIVPERGRDFTPLGGGGGLTLLNIWGWGAAAINSYCSVSSSKNKTRTKTVSRQLRRQERKYLDTCVCEAMMEQEERWA